MKQAHIIISGYVQGVWYRKFVKTNALKFGLTGWVRNLPENRVEAVLQGRIQDIEQMINLCKNGPPFAEVKDIQVEWEEAEKLTNFEIR